LTDLTLYYLTVTKLKGTRTLVNTGVTESCCEASKFHVFTAHFSVRISPSITLFVPEYHFAYDLFQLQIHLCMLLAFLDGVYMCYPL